MGSFLTSPSLSSLIFPVRFNFQAQRNGYIKRKAQDKLLHWTSQSGSTAQGKNYLFMGIFARVRKLFFHIPHLLKNFPRMIYCRKMKFSNISSLTAPCNKISPIINFLLFSIKLLSDREREIFFVREIMSRGKIQLARYTFSLYEAPCRPSNN
jgi:hypothetical protein